MSLPSCPKCNSEYTYEDGELLICPECSHEWKDGEAAEEVAIIKDAVGNVLTDGDTVTVIKDLKLKVHHLWLKSEQKQKIFAYFQMQMMVMILIVKWMVLDQ